MAHFFIGGPHRPPFFSAMKASRTTRQTILVPSIALILTLLSFAVHVTSPSSWHQNEADWQLRIEMHRSNEAFKARPFTLSCVGAFHDILGLRYRTAFFLMQFCMLFISAPVVFFYLCNLSFSFRESLWGMIIYQLSYPVFLAHFDPVYTWSDFWVYLMIPFSFICLMRRLWIPAVLAFAWAALARETTLIFLPIWLLFALRLSGGSRIRAVTVSLAAVILFVAARLSMAGSFGGELTFKLPFNFDSPVRARDTVFSMIVSLGFLWPVGVYRIFGKPKEDVAFGALIRVGAVITAIGYIGSTLLFAQARETRLFFPPFVFFIPLCLLFFRDNNDAIREAIRRHSRRTLATLVVVIVTLSMLAAMALFPGFDFRTWHDGNRAYFGLHLALTGLLILIRYRYRHA